MAYVSFIAITFGIIISAVSGTILYAGGSMVSGYLDWIPGAGLMLGRPQAALGFGVLLFIVGLVCPPSRIR